MIKLCSPCECWQLCKREHKAGAGKTELDSGVQRGRYQTLTLHVYMATAPQSELAYVKGNCVVIKVPCADLLQVVP